MCEGCGNPQCQYGCLMALSFEQRLEQIQPIEMRQPKSWFQCIIDWLL